MPRQIYMLHGVWSVAASAVLIAAMASSIRQSIAAAGPDRSLCLRRNFALPASHAPRTFKMWSPSHWHRLTAIPDENDNRFTRPGRLGYQSVVVLQTPWFDPPRNLHGCNTIQAIYPRRC